MLPMTHGVDATGLTLLEGYTFIQVPPEFRARLTVAASLLPASSMIFRFTLRRAKRDRKPHIVLSQTAAECRLQAKIKIESGHGIEQGK